MESSSLLTVAGKTPRFAASARPMVTVAYQSLKPGHVWPWVMMKVPSIKGGGWMARWWFQVFSMCTPS